jgi:molecular chaperone DnaJ
MTRAAALRTLGLKGDPSAEEVKAAHRKLSHKWHPDRHPDQKKAHASERFRAVQEAFKVLTEAQAA